MKNKHHLQIVILALLPFVAPAAFAQSWILDGTGDWEQDSNWSTGFAPTWNSWVEIDNGGRALVNGGIEGCGALSIGASGISPPGSALILSNGALFTVYGISGSVLAMGYDADLSIENSTLHVYGNVDSEAAINLSGNSTFSFDSYIKLGIGGTNSGGLTISGNSKIATTNYGTFEASNTHFNFDYSSSRTNPYIKADSITLTNSSGNNAVNFSGFLSFFEDDSVPPEDGESPDDEGPPKNEAPPKDSISTLILTSSSPLSGVFDAVQFDAMAIAAWTEETAGVFSGTRDGFRYELDYTRNSGTELWLTVTTIPEPSTYALLGGLGVVVLAVGARWRRRRKG